jgi:hypothetical protein
MKKYWFFTTKKILDNLPTLQLLASMSGILRKDWFFPPKLRPTDSHLNHDGQKAQLSFLHIVCIIPLLTENRFAKNRKNIQVKAALPTSTSLADSLAWCTADDTSLKPTHYQ